MKFVGYGMKKYSISYIDGHNMRFKTFGTLAKDEKSALKMLWDSYENGDFDHQIISIAEVVIFTKTKGRAF